VRERPETAVKWTLRRGTDEMKAVLVGLRMVLD